MPLWRCTRNRPYRDPSCPGHTDRRARQGHYIEADTAEAAVAEMNKDFPYESFTVDLWPDELGNTVIVPVKL